MDTIINHLLKMQNREGIKEFPYSCMLIQDEEFVKNIPKIIEYVKTLNLDKDPYRTSVNIIVNETLKISDILYDDEENEKLLISFISNLIAMYINTKLSKSLKKI